MVWLGTWAQLAAVGGFWALAFAGLPILALGWALKRSPIPLLVSTAIGGAAAISVFKLFQPFFYLRLRSLLNPVDYAIAQRSWLELGAIAVAVAALEMISGAIQGAGLIYMYRRAADQADAWKRTLAMSLPFSAVQGSSSGTFPESMPAIRCLHGRRRGHVFAQGLDRRDTSNR